MKLLYFPLFCILIICYGCNFKSVSTNQTTSINYDFSNPKVLHLTNALREISGLAYYNNSIYTHNDEEGTFFKINPESGKILNQTKFGKKGDYEGIEVIDDTVYVIKNNGKLALYNLKTSETTTLTNKFSKKNNIEGLTYNTKLHELLIACKGYNLDNDKKTKSIYSFNLNSKKLNELPFLAIELKQIKKFIKQHQTFDSEYPSAWVKWKTIQQG